MTYEMIIYNVTSRCIIETDPKENAVIEYMAPLSGCVYKNCTLPNLQDILCSQK